MSAVPRSSRGSSRRLEALALDSAIQRGAGESRRLLIERMDLLEQIRERIDPATLGYSHLTDFAREELGLSAGSWRSSLRLSRALNGLPYARAALEHGWITESRLHAVLPELSSENEPVWIRRAIRWPAKKLDALVRHARRQRLDRPISEARPTLPTASEEPGRVDDPSIGTDGCPSLHLVIECPVRTRFRFQAFTEETSRRLGTQAPPGRALELALNEFRARISPADWARIQCQPGGSSNSASALRNFRDSRVPLIATNPESRSDSPRVDVDEIRYTFTPGGARQAVRAGQAERTRRAERPEHAEQTKRRPKSVDWHKLRWDRPRWKPGKMNGRQIADLLYRGPIIGDGRAGAVRRRDFTLVPSTRDLPSIRDASSTWPVTGGRAVDIDEFTPAFLVAAEPCDCAPNHGPVPKLDRAPDQDHAPKLDRAPDHDHAPNRGHAPELDRAPDHDHAPDHGHAPKGAQVPQYVNAESRRIARRLAEFEAFLSAAAGNPQPAPPESCSGPIRVDTHRTDRRCPPKRRAGRKNVPNRNAGNETSANPIPGRHADPLNWTATRGRADRSQLSAGFTRPTAIRTHSSATPDRSDPKRLLGRYRRVEARRRVLRHEIADALSTLRRPSLFPYLGWDSLEDYVDARLGISLRTAYDWMQAADRRSPFLRRVESTPGLRTSTLRLLLRLERAGADTAGLRLWIDRARSTSAKILERQVAWAMADLRALRGASQRPARILVPPSWENWRRIRTVLLMRPDLLGDSRFHEAIAHPHTGLDTSLQISDAESESAGSERRPLDPRDNTGRNPHTAEGRSDNPIDGVLQISDAGSGSRQTAEPVPSSGQASGTPIRDLSRLPHDFAIPAPDSGAPSRIHIFIPEDLLDDFRRALAMLRAAYGEDKPIWWCLEVLLLHVQHGWIDEDRDFRRRTAAFAILGRDGFQCASPVCTSRRDLTVHHIHTRGTGGGDEPDNLITLCAACHQHGIHNGGRIRLRGTAPDHLIWTLADIRYEADRRINPVAPVVVAPTAPAPSPGRPQASPTGTGTAHRVRPAQRPDPSVGCANPV